MYANMRDWNDDLGEARTIGWLAKTYVYIRESVTQSYMEKMDLQIPAAFESLPMGGSIDRCPAYQWLFLRRSLYHKNGS